MRTDESFPVVQQILKKGQSLRGEHLKYCKTIVQYFMKNYMFLIGYHTQA